MNPVSADSNLVLSVPEAWSRRRRGGVGAPPLMGSLLAEGCVGWGREPPMNTALHRAGTGDEDAADEQQHTRGRGIAS